MIVEPKHTDHKKDQAVGISIDDGNYIHRCKSKWLSLSLNPYLDEGIGYFTAD
jgi:hypothetical protein